MQFVIIMDRYTRKDAEIALKRLGTVMGKQVGNCWFKNREGKWISNVGCWNLDYNPIYGGCVVTEIYNEGGAITHPFGSMRRSPREFYDAIWMTIRGIEMSRKQKQFGIVSVRQHTRKSGSFVKPHVRKRPMRKGGR